MIFTECECGEPIVVAYEAGDKMGYYRTNCKCGKIAMTELISFGGETHIFNNEEELDKFVEEKKLNKPKVSAT
jgi:hypothetical protein